MKISCASKPYIYIYMLASVIDGGEHEKGFFLPPYGNAEYSLTTVHTPHDWWITSEKVPVKGDYASFSVLSNILQDVSIAC